VGSKGKADKVSSRRELQSRIILPIMNYWTKDILPYFKRHHEIETSENNSDWPTLKWKFDCILH